MQENIITDKNKSKKIGSIKPKQISVNHDNSEKFT